MKYKVGDKVKIKSLEWYNTNKDKDGRIYCGDIPFIERMSRYCSKELTIENVSICIDAYEMHEDPYEFDWTDEMIDCLVESASDAGDHTTPTMIRLDDAAEWVKNAFVGTFGEGLANGIKDEFIKAMTK